MSSPSQLKILFTSTSYPTDREDWRGVFIAHLVHALAAQNNTQLKVWLPFGELPSNVEYLCSATERARLEHLMQQGGIAHLLRQKNWQAGRAAWLLLYGLYRVYQQQRQKVDVLHVNWLQNALPLLGCRHDKRPLLVTVLGSDFKLLNLPGMRGLLRRVFAGRPSLIAPNAEWMVKSLSEQFADVAEIRPIVFGIAQAWYQLQRNWHHIGKKNKWLVVLRITDAKMGHLLTWGKNIFQQTDQELHLFGPMQEQISLPDWVIYHGSTHPQALQDIWFPQAAGLISLSQHDEGRPQVMLEAMAAGLPIVASAISAHSNLLQHQETGYLCHEEADFKQAIQALSDAKHNEQIGQKARHWAEESIGTWDDCAQRYQQAYQDLLAQ